MPLKFVFIYLALPWTSYMCACEQETKGQRFLLSFWDHQRQYLSDTAATHFHGSCYCYTIHFFFWGVGSSEIQENREKVNNWGVFPLRLWMLGDLFLLLQPELEGFSMSVCGWISCQLPGLDLHRVQVVYQWVGNDTLTPVLIILWIPVLFLNLLSTIYFWEPSNSSPCFLSRFYSSIQWERWWSTLTPRYIEPGHFTLLTIYFFYSSKNYSC